MPDIFDSSSHGRDDSTSSESSGPSEPSAQPLAPHPPTEPIGNSQPTEPPIGPPAQPTQPEPAPTPIAAEERPRVHRHVDDYSSVMRAERPSLSTIASFAAKPLNVMFDIQDSGEHIVLLLRQHPITQVRWILIAILMAFLPVLFTSISFFDFLPANYQLGGLIMWYMLLSGFVLESFLKWFFNVYIVTDERIIDIDFESLIYKNISAAKIDNIEDTSASAGGFLASLFDYGTVTIQTAAEKREFEFDHVPQPNKVTKLINEMILEEEREKIEGRVN